jgi:butyryl-CoA dehydrogenase
MEIYALESALLRAEKLLAAKAPAAKQAVALTQYYAVKAFGTIEASARKVIRAAAEGDMLRTQMAILRRLAKCEPADTVAVGRQVAAHLITAGRYAL